MTNSSTPFTLAQDEAYSAVEHLGNSIVEAYKTFISWGSLGACAYGIGAYASLVANSVNANDEPVTADLLVPSATPTGDLISLALETAANSPLTMLQETTETIRHAGLAACHLAELYTSKARKA